MRNVSPGTENERAGLDVAEGTGIGTHVLVQGIVNVEHNRTTLPDFPEGGCREVAGTGQPENPSMDGGAVP